jgi:hypothetical protein
MSHTPPLLSKLQDGTHVSAPPLLSQHRSTIVQSLHAAAAHHQAASTSHASLTPVPLAPLSERTRTAPSSPARDEPLVDDESSSARLNHTISSSGSDHSIGIHAPGAIDDLEVGSAAGQTTPDAVEVTVDKHGMPEFARANTLERRASQTAVQNDAAWKKAQALMRKNGEMETDDISPLFAHVPSVSAPVVPTAAESSAPRTLRPSIAQQQTSLLGASLSGDNSSYGSIIPTDEPAGEWDLSNLGRMASGSQSFLSSSEQAMMTQLPKEFGGAAKLTMPAYLTGPISNVTLPSRLDLLGRRGFKLLGALAPRRIGNAVLGWSPVITTSWSKKEWRIRNQLFLLPRIFSKSMAKILLFLRFVFLALVVIFLLDIAGVANANPGRVWAIGIFLALVVMWQQSEYRRAPDGVMAFCRSMGVPEVEEYMFR